jgi:hypothetical protein
LTASGGNQYIWNTGQTTSTISVFPITTTTYTVTVTNVEGCSATASRTVEVLPLPVVSISGPGNICENVSATLTASGGQSYLWNTGATTASIVVSPSVSTTYTVTATDANGCTATSSKTVSVNTTPVISIAGDDLICEGGSVTLTASGASSYLWNTGATSPSITVSPTVSTTYTVTATDGNGCSATASKTVTISSIPVFEILGRDTICEGESTTLTVSLTGTYLWNTGATTSGITVTPSETTTYTVTVTDANGCTSTKSVTVVVKENITITVSGDNVICLGESTTLTVAGATSYIWNTGATTQSITVSPNSTTTYSVSTTNSEACNGTGSITVTVNPLPDITITGRDTICEGECTTLTASGGIEYSWDNVNDVDCNGAYFIGGLQNNGAQSLYRYTSGGTLTEIGATGTTRLNGVGFYCHGNEIR